MPPELAARSATMAETMPPAAPVTTKTVSGPRVRPGWPSAAGASVNPTVQRSPPAWPISTAPGSVRVSATSTSAISAGLRASSKSTAFTSASRSRRYAFKSPVTAPPIGAGTSAPS